MLLLEVCCGINLEIGFWDLISTWVNVCLLRLKYGVSRMGSSYCLIKDIDEQQFRLVILMWSRL
ncbi:hypothetical protein Godav_029214 [Gossypium davidsonii]|uniref:Uncharacterized protein n=1 Tax=Gossypium davidsonii TaxID=34287 RepID=A0A7J8TIH0_GOSDV|nr:hypothetical protein [Gossypium davidsonii]